MPPGLRSSVTETTSKPFGPHHWPNCSSSVHAFHTGLRGALNVRLMKNSNALVRSPGFVVVLVTLLTSRFVSSGPRRRAMSNFFICRNASVTRCDFAWSGSTSIRTRPWARPARRGRICPSASRRVLRTSIGKLRPEILDFFLVVAMDLKRDRLAELELRATVQRDKSLAVDRARTRPPSPIPPPCHGSPSLRGHNG